MPDDVTQSEQFELAVDWSAADGMTAVYANHVLTQVTPDEAVLIFGQIIPPALDGGGDAIRSYLKEHGGVSARPVAKIVMTPEKLYQLIEVLGTTAEKLDRVRALRDARAVEGGETP